MVASQKRLKNLWHEYRTYRAAVNARKKENGS